MYFNNNKYVINHVNDDTVTTLPEYSSPDMLEVKKTATRIIFTRYARNDWKVNLLNSFWKQENQRLLNI